MQIAFAVGRRRAVLMRGECPIRGKCIAKRCLPWIAKQYDDYPGECILNRLIRLIQIGRL